MARTGTLRTAFTLILSLSLWGCAGGGDDGASDDNVVNVYNWADYIAPDTLRNFEAEYGIKVNYDTYDSSDMVDVKLLSGNSGYDVVVHSNQYSSRLAPIGVYQRLDLDRIPNTINLDPGVMSQLDVYEHVRGYQLPYHWGSTGYAWNVELVRERLPNHPMDSADVLFDPEVVSKLADCGVTLLDGATDLFPMALAYLGLDPRSTDAESLAAAEAQVAKVRPYIRYFSNSKMLSDLPNKEVCVAMSWSGDYAQASARAEEAGIDIELRYTMPKEGSGLWIDGLYIPADAPHVDNAYLFIDYLMRADVAANIANTVYYANANRASWEYIDAGLRDNTAVFPDERTWDILFPIETASPKEERLRTRAFARVKSGI